MDTLRRIIGDWCAGGNPRRSIKCPSCGAHIELKTLDAEPTLQNTPSAGESRGVNAALPNKYPRPIIWIVIFSVISGLWGLWFSDLWTTMPTPHDRYHIFMRIFAALNLPLDSLLLVSSIALLTPSREWGRQWILGWSAAASILQTLSLLSTMLWVAPVATVQDVPPELAQALPLISGTPGQAINWDADFAWLSILFLATWIYWVLTRNNIKYYFQPNHAVYPSKAA